MRTKIFPLLAVCLVCLFSARAQTVVENESSIVINDRTADVFLVLDNYSRNSNLKIDIELLDAENKTRSQASNTVAAKNGKNSYKISLPLGDLLKTAGDEIAWYLLRYRVGDRSGIVSVSELIKDVFELRVAASERVFPGMNYRVRVRAVHPFTKTPVRNVRIESELTLELDTDDDEDELILKAKTETDREGFAVLGYKIPADAKLDYDGELKIKGSKNGIVREIEEDIDADEANGSVLLTTDKPLYQPGQNFSARALYLDANNTVVTDSELEFTIKDEDGTTLYRETVKTSAFGIAAVSWKIPENAKLGSYRVEIEADDELDDHSMDFKVTRYDLPNFSVKAKSDKTFYLPTDKQAEISVTADYLFGKPVTKAKVRVVQESERRWNYKEQKYDVTEEAVYEGAADADGKYVAKVDLTEEIADLMESGWRRYEDLHFAAYYTDLTTNKTEQKRFDLRLSKEPIHIYFIRHRNYNANLPITAYLSTFYADGSPAVCDVEIKGEGETVARTKTNSFGAGKFEFNASKDDAAERKYDLNIVARDRQGRTGTFEENLYFETDDTIKLEIDKTIFKPGETIKINVASTKKDGFVYVDLVKEWTVIASHLVKLKNGRADLKIPYDPRFKGDLTIAAYGDDSEDYWDYTMRVSRGVIFPEQQNLLLDANFEKAVFSPNEEARVKFSVKDGIGKAVESALGVVIFDKAVEERARTDAEFGSYFKRYFGLLGYAKSFGGVTLKDLNDLNLSKPIPEELQLVAEIMLANSYFYPRIYHSEYDQTEPKTLYDEYFKNQFAPVEAALKQQYEKTFEHPTDEASLKNILSRNGIDFDQLRDPWGSNYRAVFEIDKTENVVRFETAGANKKFDLTDDFAVSSASFKYFTPVGKAIDEAVENYHRRTGAFIRDAETLRAELLRQNIELDKIKDRWNRNYRVTFEVLGRSYLIRFYSLGANGVYEPTYWNRDDFEIWKSAIDYFAKTELKINEIFSQTVNGGRRDFPLSEDEFKKILRENDFPFENIKDGYGSAVYLIMSRFSRYNDKTTVENGKQKLTPVTEEVVKFSIRSRGESQWDARDDFDLASFTGVLNERSKDTKYETKNIKTVAFSGARGAIRGTVTDPTGAVIPGATVTATDEADSQKTFSTDTNDSGEFLLENLPSGKYTVKIYANGFNSSVYTGIQIRSQALVEISATLDVGTISEMVSVQAQSESNINTTNSSVQTTVTKSEFPKIPNVKNIEETSTPRLREYFPETLVWNPEIVTDKNGRAEMKFRMADNITTWKLYTIASTKNGKIGVAEKEIQAFQPFFVDLEPPKFLTDGDEIHLPAQIRNYTEKRQKVEVSMAKSDWFDFLDADKRRIEVSPNDSENAVFGFKAVSAVKDGRQRVTALAGRDSDAIEKPVTVRPNGQEIVRTESKLFRQSQNFEIDFPASALPKTQRAEVKIYPNLFSHVAESVEGLLQRPYGCGEQTTSSTYPNLMILKFTKKDDKLRQTADKFLRKGYERLVGYQVASGGFSYWGGREEADIALTAYALRFLNDAAPFVEVDAEIIERAQNWLVAQQRADGGFTKKYNWENAENSTRTKLLTSYVARTLAMIKARQGDKVSTEPADAALQKSLVYLKRRNAEIDEPYALALFGLAALDAGNAEDAAAIAERLEKMAIAENETVYWKLETNTPFYGWGTPGRVETTALVLQLLIKTKDQRPKTEDLISKGTLFLLKNKDRYGVWYSTQTTVNVLDAFLAALAEDKTTGEPDNETFEISLNGENLQTISISPDQIAPVVFDLSGKLNASANRIELRSSSDSSVMAQIVAGHYIEWRDAKLENASDGAAANTKESRQIRLRYECDKQIAAIMDDITCSVETERVGFRGYGMLLAEIGIPPGADVSRESLENALASDWSLSRYEILPDRIILYMWSRGGGTKFNFKFRPRYGINAQTPASVVYDYYNEEAKATIAPLKFSVK